tara:strand:+ start:116 stop:1528 length:1413 start_codon:yes stop_codon:yes gene_type:complete
LSALKKLVNQTAIYGLSSVIGRLLNYLLVPLYTRYFLPEEYGVVTEIYAYVALFIVILTYGMETAFFRFSKKENSSAIVYSTTLISILFTSIFFIIIIYFNSAFIASWIGYGNNKEYVQWFAIILALDAVSSVSFASLREQNKAVRFTIIRLINIFLNIILNIYFIVYKDYGIEYIFISNLLSSILTTILLFPEIVKCKWIFDVSLWKKMILYALPLLVAGLAGMINETIDRILLKNLLQDQKTVMSEVGLYGAFYKLSIIMTLFIQTFRYAAEPFFFSQEKKSESKKIYADVMKYFIIVSVFIFLTVIIFYDLAEKFIGPNYHDERGFLVVSILLLANLFLGMYYNLSIWYKITEKTKYGAYFSILGAIITIILNIILIPIIGFVGSALATLVCYLLMTLSSYFIGRKYFQISYNIKRIALYLMVMLLIYGIVFITDFSMLANSSYLIAFIVLVFVLEKPKKLVFSSPK